MPTARINGVNLHYEEHGAGTPLVFVHEFAGDVRSWEPQVRFFSRRYRTVLYNARGYPPSEVPADPGAYSPDAAALDLLGVLEHLALPPAHVVGFSMGGSGALLAALRKPSALRSLVVAGAGYGSMQDREAFQRDVEQVAQRLLAEGMAPVADVYARGPMRVQFLDKDPRGYREFHEQLRGGSALGHANTLRGVQKQRPTMRELEPRLRELRVPTLILTGDEDEPCLEPALFMKRTIPSAALVVMPQAGHTVNLEDPDAFNRHVQEFIGAVDSGRWRMRNPASLSQSAVLPTQEVRR